MKPDPVLVDLAVLGPLLSFATPQSPSAEAPAVKAVQVEKGPVLDGRLDDEVWRKAPVFSGFKMVFQARVDELGGQRRARHRPQAGDRPPFGSPRQ